MTKTTHRFIEWNARLVLGIQLIDSQHEKLVHLTNNLHVACLKNREIAKRYFIKTAREAVRYADYHFSTEEQMMIFLGYPDFRIHKKEHEGFIKEILRQTFMFAEHKNLVPNRFVQYLREWILSHIAVCDKDFANYIFSYENCDKLEVLFINSA